MTSTATVTIVVVLVPGGGLLSHASKVGVMIITQTAIMKNSTRRLTFFGGVLGRTHSGRVHELEARPQQSLTAMVTIVACCWVQF